MATGGADLLTQLCADLLTCEICTEDFDHGTRTPRVLPCHHCFCGTCMEKLTKDGSLKCPKCQGLTTVAGKFPVETTRMALLDKRRALQSQEGVVCEGCTEGDKATSRCQDCEEFLCEFCSSAHRRQKLFKEHTLVSLTEAMKNPENLLQTTEKCQQHSDEKLKLYCVTCSKAVCSVCALTLHLDGHKFVESRSVLNNKKKEMLELCEQLDKVEQSFRAKAEESEAMVAAVESNLNEAVLEAAAHTAAQFGRTCVSLSLASQVFSQGPEMKKTLEELDTKTTAEVSPAPKYEILTDKLAELEALMKEIGVQHTATATPRPSHRLEPVAVGLSVAQPVVTGVSFPSIQLDSSRSGDECQVGADNCFLSNQPCTHSRSPFQVQRFRFAGTVALPGTSSYWQVRSVLTPKPEIKNNERLCEFGVATQEALQNRREGYMISFTRHCAVTAWIYIEGDQAMVGVMYRMTDLSRTALAPFKPTGPLELTLGFLLDTATARLHVIDVSGTRLLCSSDIDLSQPVWPAVQVWPERVNGAGVDVVVQSGQKISRTGDLVKLLQSLLGRGSM